MTSQQDLAQPAAESAPTPSIHERLSEELARARRGGSEKNREKIVASGKLLVRDRLKLLFDDEQYVEDGLLARHTEDLPGDAVVCAYGTVDGRKTCVIANDYSVKAGTWGSRTFEKITFAQETAVRELRGATRLGEHLLQPGADLGSGAAGLRPVRPVASRLRLRPGAVRPDHHGAR